VSVEAQSSGMTSPVCVSLLLGALLADDHGGRLGTVRDVVVRLDATSPRPEVTGLVARVLRRDLFVPRGRLSRLDAVGASLREPSLQLDPFVRRDGELLLFADALDRQMLDVAGRRLLRLDEQQLLTIDGHVRLVGIESGPRSLVRRLLPRAMARRVRPGTVVDWAEAEYLPGRLPVVRLHLPRERLARLRPADLAALLQRVAYPEARAMLGTLAPQVVAEALEELRPNRHADLVEGLEDGHAAAILQAMAPESAARLIGALDAAHGERLLQRLPEHLSDSLQDLRAYPPGTVGALMSPSVTTVVTGTGTGAAIEALRRSAAPRPRAALFVVDAQRCLVGTVRLGALVTADPCAAIETLVAPDVAPMPADEPASRLPEHLAAADALEPPVVDGARRLVGAVSADVVVQALVRVMLLLLVANAGTTVAELAGVAAAGELFGIPRWVAVPLVAVGLGVLIVRLPYRPAERVFLALSALMLAYVGAAVLAHPDWSAVARGLVLPTLPADMGEVALLVAIWGAIITPYQQFFFQAAVVDKGATERDLGAVQLDAAVGAVGAGLIAICIVIATGATLHATGVTIDDAATAARALEPVAGAAASALFGAGLLGAALLAAGVVPLSTAYAVCEAFGWERGLSLSWREAPAFYGLFLGLLGLAALVVLWPGLPLMRAMVASQLLAGLLLPPPLAFILLLVNDRRLLGRAANGPLANAAGLAMLALLTVLEIGLIVQAVAGRDVSGA
jgi:Mn2+/Fe2+ NRAMP family transporter